MTQTFQEIKVPPLGESVSEATIASWLKKKGDFVNADDILVELETDKVTLEVTAPHTGILKDIKATEGSTVAVGDLLAVIDTSAKAAAPQAEDSSAEREPPVAIDPSLGLDSDLPKGEASLSTAPQATSPSNGATNLSPAVRRMVEENNLNPTQISATGKGGRLTKADIVQFMEAPSAEISAPAPAAFIPTEGPSSISPTPMTLHPDQITAQPPQRVRMTRLRQRIAERLKQAQNTAAILTTFNEVDMSAVMQLRKQYKDAFSKKYGGKLGFMSFFTKACIQALKDIPVVNASIEGDEIVYPTTYDISVAISAPQGLVVPVVRNADQKSFSEIEQELSSLGQKAKDNKLSINDLTGGTFTISNGGTFGSLVSTPILNPPQSAILGMHKIQDRPVVIKGEIVVRPMMYLALSYDHRLIDGKDAVTFLVRIKECIEDPQRLLLAI